MSEGKARVPTDKERKRLFELESSDPRNTAMLYLSYGCGLRVGEIATLNLGDVIDEDGKVIDSFDLKGRNTKSGKPRTVYLANKKVREALAEYVAHLRTKGDVYLAGPLFMSYRRDRMSPNTLQQVFAWMYERAGLKGCKSHSGRRYYATKLLNEGTDVRSVQELMGHANINQTGRYADTDPVKLKAVAAKVI